jgi:metallo-beta-lactamase class B
MRMPGSLLACGTVTAMSKKTILLAALLLAVLPIMSGCSGPNPASIQGSSPTTMPAVSPKTDFPHIPLAEDLYLRQIREGVYVVTHAFPWPANSLIIEMENSDLVLAGTPYTPEAMDTVLQWIRGQFGGRKITAVNPGYHVDNLGGNSALIAAGIPVYGSDLTVRMLEERGEQTRQLLLDMLPDPADESYRKAHAAIPYIPPDHLFPAEEGLTLSFGQEQVVVYWPGPTQAPDKMVIYFPGKKVLFGSCMVLAGEKPGNISEADLENWPDAIEKLKQFDAAFVVPGHGDRLDPGLLDHTIALLSVAE